MKISSLAFKNGDLIPPLYTCDGEDKIPPLEISQIPSGTESSALICDDPDSPSGEFTHWIIWNIAAETAKIKQGEAPAGAIEGINDFGKNGYGGPCPGSGKHRYFFRFFALDTKLNLNPQARKKDLIEAMEGHIIEQAELFGTYERG